MSTISNDNRLIFYSRENGLWRGTVRKPGHRLDGKIVIIIGESFYWKLLDTDDTFIQHELRTTFFELIEKVEIEFQQRLDSSVEFEERD